MTIPPPRPELLRATIHTPVSDVDLALALLRVVPETQREAFAVMWAQYCAETGRGRYCFNHNLGNVKHVRGDGFDYIALHGVWEGTTLARFEEMKKGPFGAAIRLDEDRAHQKAVAPNVAVVFEPPHPATWFRAYDSLEHAVTEHVAFLRTRYALAWEGLVEGDLEMFVHQLKARGYFTANEESYLRGLHPFYTEALASSAFEHAIALRKDEMGEEITSPIVYALPDPIPVVVDLSEIPEKE